MVSVRQLLQTGGVAEVHRSYEASAREVMARIEPHKAQAVQAYERELRTDFSDGETVYMRSCAFCHGKNGDGNGPEAANLDIKPSNLATTRSTRQFFLQVMEQGVRGTAMPYFSFYSKAQRNAVVDYLDTRFAVLTTPGQPD